MHLETPDWIILISFFVLTFCISLAIRKQAQRSLSDFFLGGRKLPWYLAGISMVATTFAADTPLAVSEIVAVDGIAGNWLWWNALAGGLLTTFFFANLWRRSGVLTEVEFIELRYSGRAASWLRGFKAVYLGLFMNVMIIGWVNLALMSLLQVFFDLSVAASLWFAAVAMLFVSIYSSIGGLKGIALTDSIQFVLAMVGCIVLAVLVVGSDAVGGISGLKAQLAATGALHFLPRIGSAEGAAAAVLALPVGTFLAFITMQWWASWYPGAEPGGGGYVAQRMMSTRSEKDAVWSSLLFQIAHYCIRPWPWILVGLCAIVLYPDLDAADKKLGFVMAMKDFLPTGLRGLLLTAFLAAYMSTISTQLNWGASYLVNDLYLRFINPDAQQERLVRASRLTTLLLMVVGIGVTSQLTSIKAVWEFVFQCGAGLGMVLILRWYWWRINAWSEISATLAPFAAFAFLNFTKMGRELSDSLGWGFAFMSVVGFTTVIWLLVTFNTRPTRHETLVRFFRKVRPQGWWGPFMDEAQRRTRHHALIHLSQCWLGALVMTYASLFLIGKIIFGEWQHALVNAGLAVAGFLLLRHGFRTAQRHQTQGEEQPS